jgi:orotidine-5'-phosphate decarboxylase
VVGRLRGRGFDVFVDLKLLDIPHQVSGAAAALSRLGASMFTVHACGGSDMIRAAAATSREAAQDAGLPRPKILAVTVLTSMDADTLAEVGVHATPDEQVATLAAMALKAGADGIVCSPLEAAAMRELLGRDALIVTPGVRPAFSAASDQSRIATAAEALHSGATHLVVGRPITGAEDPAAAASRLLSEMNA